MTGVLSADPFAEAAEAPLAIVCQFDQEVSDAVLREAHRLCWNLSHASLLVTLEPSRLQAWTCALAPKRNRRLGNLRLLEQTNVATDAGRETSLQSEVAQTLHWVNLVSGEFLRQHENKFRKEERVDALLVSNLRAVRKRLLSAGLERDTCHALLARLIFTQFLFQRTDSDGHPAISQGMLDSRFDDHLRNQYTHATALEHILQEKEETYRLFRWLNEKFNGDLFPGKGSTPEEREEEWRTEKNRVRVEHLKLLSEFVSGTLDLDNNQQSFWPEYSFDTIPLEFISSVYEEFLNEDQLKLSAYYTPPHLVDFVLDGVLPWSGTEWDLQILDPCCGSGIFLVKAFQRLVQRWKNAHTEEEPRIDDLRGIIEKNLLGCDASEDAVRVASFSLCLALCDAIDPKHYWKRTLFPTLRNDRLLQRDFFSEDLDILRSRGTQEERHWDLVIGNAPWRGGAMSDDSPGIKWAELYGWPVADKNPGPLFLAKGAAITKPTGRIAMIQPAATLLYQRSWEPSDRLRRRLFSDYTVEEIVTFVHLRWVLFKNAKSPACLVTLQPKVPSREHKILYTCPRPLGSSQDDAVVAIERHDIHEVSSDEAIHDPAIWTILLLGSRRDAVLISALRRHATIRKLKASSAEAASDEQVLLTREGIIRGLSKQRDEEQILNRRILEAPNFPDPDSMTLDASSLPINRNPKVDHKASSTFVAFEHPQLIIKTSIVKAVGRFQAQLVTNKRGQKGIICTQSYVSVHQFRGDSDWLRAACLAFRSQLSAYYLVLTSRLAFDRGEALSNDMLDVPVPPPEQLSEKIDNESVDAAVEKAFGLKSPEQALISDLLSFVYRDGGKDGNEKPGREPTHRDPSQKDGDLQIYADFFLKSLRATFGKDRAVRATVFEEEARNNPLPVRMLAVHLDWPERRGSVMTELVGSGALRQRMAEFYRDELQVRSRQGQPILCGLGFQRIARLFVTHQAADGKKVPTVLLLKPDQRRYWTRSQALRDADELAATIVASGQRRHKR